MQSWEKNKNWLYFAYRKSSACVSLSVKAGVVIVLHVRRRCRDGRWLGQDGLAFRLDFFTTGPLMPVGAGKRREDCYCSIAVLFCPGPGFFFPEIVPLPVSTPLRLKSSDTSPSPFLSVPRAKGDSEGNRGRGREGRRGGRALSRIYTSSETDRRLLGEKKRGKEKGRGGRKVKTVVSPLLFLFFFCLSRKLLSAPPWKGRKGRR